MAAVEEDEAAVEEEGAVEDEERAVDDEERAVDDEERTADDEFELVESMSTILPNSPQPVIAASKTNKILNFFIYLPLKYIRCSAYISHQTLCHTKVLFHRNRKDFFYSPA